MDITLYIGTSYYFDGERFRDPQIVSISDSLDETIFYLAKIRQYFIMQVTSPSVEDMEALSAAMGVNTAFFVVAEITKYNFPDEQYMNNFLSQDQREDYVLINHGKVDHKLARIKKEESRDVMVPEIVEQIILAESNKFNAEMEITLHSLKRLLFFLGNEKERGMKHGPNIFKTCEYLKEVTSGKDDILDEMLYRRHPILFCSEPEYRNTLRVQREINAMDASYYHSLNGD